MFDDSLILSPHVFLKGILFRHRAFEAPSLTYPDEVNRLDIHLGKWELPMPLKASMDDVYVFRQDVGEIRDVPNQAHKSCNDRWVGSESWRAYRV
jgi:hypothetical protein